MSKEADSEQSVTNDTITPARPVPNQGRILVADDDEVFLKVISEVLLRQGFEVQSVSHAAAASEALRAAAFDLLIADIHMPGNDGLELVRDLATLAPGLPTILLTGQPTVETAAQSVRLAVMAYLTKPLDVAELIGLARQAVAKSRACRALHLNHLRLRDWSLQLEELETALRDAPVADTDAAWQTFLTLSLSHIIESLIDLKSFTEALLRPRDQTAAAAHLEASRPLVLIEALRETITVLEKTKTSFKSRELAELRAKLERLLQGHRPGPVRPLAPDLTPVRDGSAGGFIVGASGLSDGSL